MAFHKYTPFGDEFYDPILDFQIKTLNKYQKEFDMVYFVDSNWNIDFKKTTINFPCQIIKVSPHLRYYDAYKEVLPQIKEDLVLFMDNDMIIHKPGRIQYVFDLFDYIKWGHQNVDVASIMDTIGTWKSDKLKKGNKFCPYWFAAKREKLMKYLDVDWSPDSMPDFETLGKLTKAMVEDGLDVVEIEDNKSEVINWESLETEKARDTKRDAGIYHIRAGSTIAYLMATKRYGDQKTYWDYLKNQPKSEILRHINWHKYIGGDTLEILEDLSI